MRVFIWAARVEGLSFVALMGIAMPLKYALGVGEVVKYAGRLHGALVVVFVLALATTAWSRRWATAKVTWAALSSLIPFGWVYFEASDRLDSGDSAWSSPRETRGGS